MMRGIVMRLAVEKKEKSSKTLGKLIIGKWGKSPLRSNRRVILFNYIRYFYGLTNHYIIIPV